MGRHIPEQTTLAPGVFAELQPTLLSQSGALQGPAETWPGAGDSRCLLFRLLWCEVFHSQLMTAMGTLCSAGLSRKNPLHSILLLSAI